jgi:siroheme synthase
LGAAAAAHIPLTHRRTSSALVLLTAQQASDSEAANWSKLVGSGSTLVIYMPGRNYLEISKKLKAAGLAGDTPCAIISRATSPRQQVHRTTISELQDAPAMVTPTLLVVGEVVRFADAAVLNEFVSPSLAADRSVLSSVLADFQNDRDSNANEEPIA